MSTTASTAVRWAPLCRVAAVAALISAIFIPVQVAVFLVWPPLAEATAADWFTLLHENRPAGLVDLDLLLVADNILLIPIILALFVLLREASPSLMMIASGLGFTGIVMYLASNPAMQMAILSDKYAAAATETDRIAALAGGEATLAMWQGTAFHCAYLLGSAAGILFGFALLQSGVFSKLTGWLAVAANVVALGLYVPRIGIYISVFSVLFLEIWYLLLARRLHQLSRRQVT